MVLASATDRGMYASKDEADIVVDLVTQLEALNPTADPALQCEGEWDLTLTNTQLFRSSPFFLAIRSALGDDNKQIADNGFELHNRATSVSRIGRVRQTVKDGEVVSEVDLEVGLLPGLPVRVKGTVVTTAGLKVVAPETWELTVRGTRVTGSNVPFLDEYLDDVKVELPVGDFYSTVLGNTPVSTLKTFYVDDSIRITRDCDENFYVFSRA
uniref:Plastid lipid-associated protein/fibrillin conserved domain-containing protein n=1 Tax=Pseudictyota dubia TaxID=2749911 RepID=A0A7R9Z4E9_9STRA|mmetsp:Transcript_22097/g.41181  ORF Transcript_22097/g.41181 Transcript_22097/m.41181 type:complete len:212 (+) Transcript_22097:3-638(+)